MKTIRALSQPEAEFYQPNEDEVLISIATPTFREVKYPIPNLANWEGRSVLKLAFHDTDPKRFDGKSCQHMTKHDAHLILDFVRAHEDKSIVIHCWRGKSRSPTILEVLRAAHPSQYKIANDDISAWHTNNHVKMVMWDVFVKRKEENTILQGFKAHTKRPDLHEEERGMSSQMYEAGWQDCKKYFNID